MRSISFLIIGLLARGLAAIGPRGGLEGWRWIMIIEGLLASRLFEQNVYAISDTLQTFACGALSYLCLPNNIETAAFLTVEERQFARERMQLDNFSVPEGYVDVFTNFNPGAACPITIEFPISISADITQQNY